MGRFYMKRLSVRQKKWIEKTVAADRSYKKLVYTRFFLCAFLVFLQFCAYVLGFLWLGTNWLFVNIIFSAIGFLFVLHLFNRTDKPSSKLNWILLMMLFPVVGVPMYLAFGEGRSVRKMARKIGDAHTKNEKAFIQISPQNTRVTGNLEYYLEQRGYPSYTDGDVVYYPSGKEAFAQMIKALEKAEKYILLEYFIVAGGKMWKEMLSVLLKKAMQGVKIYVIYDDFGSLLVLPPKYDRYLESLHENIRCLAFNRVMPVFSAQVNNRDHRKMTVVDGKVAFTGGMNLADEYIDEKVRFGHWKDSAVRVTGGAVNSFVFAFFNVYNAYKPVEDLSDFLVPCEQERSGDVIIPYDVMPGEKSHVAETVYLEMINSAKEYLYITTPYLILDDFMRAALCNAAMRGVDVRIVTPSIPDKKVVFRLTRANYEILMKAGVKIYEYTPGFIHAKNVVSDGKGIVGTINFDYRSLYLHFENAVYFTTPSAVEKVKSDFEDVFSASALCDENMVKSGFFGKLLDSVLRVFEMLL